VETAGRGGGGGASATQKSLTFKCGPHQATRKPAVSIFPGYLMTS
jgi:hypothetical protein